MWDADGNEYIEYGMGNRAVGLGHAHPPVVEAVQAGLKIGPISPARARRKWNVPSSFLS